MGKPTCMDKRGTVLLLAEQIEEWGDDNDIAMSPMDMIELGERIFNILDQLDLGTVAAPDPDISVPKVEGKR